MWFPGNGTWQPIPFPAPPFFANADYSSQPQPADDADHANHANINTVDPNTLAPNYGYPFGTVQASPSPAPTSPGILFNSTVHILQATPC